MCNVAAVMQGAGATSSVVSSYYGAKANQSSLNLQADLSAINARISESTAQVTLLAGQRDEQRSRLSTAQLKSTQRASMAANGLDLGVGSAAQILATTDLMGEVDAATVHANAVRSAWGYRTQSVNQSNQAALSRASADAISPLGSAATTLLGSGAQVAANWYQYASPTNSGDGLTQGARRKLGVF